VPDADIERLAAETTKNNEVTYTATATPPLGENEISEGVAVQIPEKALESTVVSERPDAIVSTPMDQVCRGNGLLIPLIQEPTGHS
jgi:hypothetical protein